jgi:hypothetical protein
MSKDNDAINFMRKTEISGQASIRRTFDAKTLEGSE